MKKILVLGSMGYIGQAFSAYFISERVQFHTVNRQIQDYTKFHIIRQIIQETNAGLVVNCAAYVPANGVSHCDENKLETLRANSIFPAVLANACEAEKADLIHLSTGCLFDEKREYDETDTPIRGFSGHCGTYVGSKLIAEQAVSRYERSYILRLRLPFDEFNHPRNYLTKLAGFSKVYDHINSLTHRGDFVKAAMDLWKFRAPFGVYHVCNPGQVTARQVLIAMQLKGIIRMCPDIDENSGTFGCRLATQKLQEAGIKLRPVEHAMVESIKNWQG